MKNLQKLADQINDSQSKVKLNYLQKFEVINSCFGDSMVSIMINRYNEYVFIITDTEGYNFVDRFDSVANLINHIKNVINNLNL